MGNQINLSDLVASSDVSIKPLEHAEERGVRLEAEKRKLKIEAYTSVFLFVVFFLAVSTIITLCVYKIFLDASTTDEVRRTAQSLLIPVLAAVVSFLAGRKIGSK